MSTRSGRSVGSGRRGTPRRWSRSRRARSRRSPRRSAAMARRKGSWSSTISTRTCVHRHTSSLPSSPRPSAPGQWCWPHRPRGASPAGSAAARSGRRPAGRVEVGEHGHHPPVHVGLADQAELLEHRPTCFSTARSLMYSVAAVAALLRPIASSRRTSSSRSVSDASAEGVWLGRSAQQPLDHLGVERGPAARDVVQRTDQLAQLADALLEQVAETGDAVGEQVVGVVLLDVLGEDDDPVCGNSTRIRLAASIPSVVNVGGIRMSVSTASGWCRATARCRASGSATVSTRSTSALSVSSAATPSRTR